MGTASKSSRRRRRRGLRGSKSANPVLDALEVRFARFRAEHPPRTRVPADLRASAVAALSRGVTSGDLFRRCGVSWSQLKAWKSESKSVRPKTRARDPSPDAVRVFSVVDEEAVVAHAAPVQAEPALELRLGRWSVRVQLAELAEGQ